MADCLRRDGFVYDDTASRCSDLCRFSIVDVMSLSAAVERILWQTLAARHDEVSEAGQKGLDITSTRRARSLGVYSGTPQDEIPSCVAGSSQVTPNPAYCPRASHLLNRAERGEVA